ncbi:hypothetical protein [Streptomyces boluensis]|uniref:Uncharacterized protein n=1 Tax=Streptomyces boluensis TaxID=1775135 RepID=A0A964UW49_9ACTN|nr:hypothetical protein [Streptomyces boluensis]NBE53972.1 hypothetical protein [Streptomyces boluensis]
MTLWAGPHLAAVMHHQAENATAYVSERLAESRLSVPEAAVGDGPQSPLGRAEDAKHRCDLVGEVGALLSGHDALTRAPWYPSQPGDRLKVTVEATESEPRWTETYEVTEDGRALRHVEHTAPDDDLAGWFAGPPEFVDSDPFETPWMEAGPDRLAITRGGRIVHQGRHALARPDTAEARVATAASADSGVGLAVVHERESTPAEHDALQARIIARGAEATTRHQRQNP